jgi:hypothetical protein
MTMTIDQLREALHRLPAPEPPAGLLARIQRSRTAGVHVQLPADQSPVKRHAVAWLGLAAAVIAGVWLWSAESRVPGGAAPRDPLAELLRGTLVWPAPGGAQESPRTAELPKYQVVRAADLAADRVRPGTWTYDIQNITDDILTQTVGRSQFRLARGQLDGREVWLVSSSRQGLQGSAWGPLADTGYLDPTSLRPLRHRMGGYKGRTVTVQTFTTDSGYEAIDVTGPGRTPPRSFRGTVALPFPGDAPFVTGWYGYNLRILAQALPLARGWRGSLYEVGWFSLPGRPGGVPVDVRVVGRDRVTVPAGTFDCWRLEIDHAAQDSEMTVWVARAEGWVVKTQLRGSDWKREDLLVSYSPDP